MITNLRMELRLNLYNTLGQGVPLAQGHGGSVRPRQDEDRQQAGPGGGRAAGAGGQVRGEGQQGQQGPGPLHEEGPARPHHGRDEDKLLHHRQVGTSVIIIIFSILFSHTEFCSHNIHIYFLDTGV